MFGGAGRVREMGLASKGWSKPGLVLNLFQCIVIFSERSCGPSFVANLFITQHNISCIGVLGFREVCQTHEKVWQVQLDHLEGNPAREQLALLRQLSFFVFSLSFCASVCFCVYVYLLYCIFVFSLRAGECMAQPAVPTFAHQLAIWLSPCSFAILPFFVFLFFSAFCLSFFLSVFSMQEQAAQATAPPLASVFTCCFH